MWAAWVVMSRSLCIYVVLSTVLACQYTSVEYSHRYVICEYKYLLHVLSWVRVLSTRTHFLSEYLFRYVREYRYGLHLFSCVQFCLSLVLRTSIAIHLLSWVPLQVCISTSMGCICCHEYQLGYLWFGILVFIVYLGCLEFHYTCVCVYKYGCSCWCVYGCEY